MTIRSASQTAALKTGIITKSNAPVAKYSQSATIARCTAAKSHAMTSRTILHALLPTCGRLGTNAPTNATMIATISGRYGKPNAKLEAMHTNGAQNDKASPRAAPYQRRTPPLLRWGDTPFSLSFSVAISLF